MTERRAVRTGQAVQPSKITVAEILLDYANYKKETSSAVRLGYAMNHLLDFFDAKTLDHVNRETIQTYGDNSNRAAGTLRRELVCLRAAISHAVSMNHILPMPKIKLPNGGKPKNRWLDKNETARLLRSAGKDFRTKFQLRLFIMIAFLYWS